MQIHGFLAFPVFLMEMIVTALILSYFSNAGNGFGPTSNENLEISMKYLLLMFASTEMGAKLQF